ncbi:alpha/beta fold hydrolase [Nocardia panacis]|uniref:Alpha/beta fold hydrolase n=1 Tax=Nocardia panacis TaxID=2340916 RepID=A0A3A4KC09_9NOCA|nr:alpha/beta fold hydrolase [Nocardia panacis]RJO70168.1 alpha/beta fold hydrolase [Nocardia panacis]
MGAASPAPLSVRRSGSGPSVVLVHGGMPARVTWSRQSDLESRWSLIIPSRRGFPPSPAASWQDFFVDAEDLVELIDQEPEAVHLVGFSYGGLGSCLAAEQVPHRIRSLTLIEVPLWVAADGDESVRELAALTTRFAADADDRQAEREFFSLAGVDENMSAGADDIRRALELARRHRDPWEATPRFEVLAAAGLAALVVSGDSHPALERLCDAVADLLGAERACVPGAGHAVPRAPGFNSVLETFLAAAERRGAGRVSG